MEYLNLDIRMELGEPYRLYATSPELGDAEGTLSIDCSETEFQTALGRLFDRETNRKFLKEFGWFLFQHLFNSEIGAHFEQATGFALARKKRGIRLRFHIRPDELSVIPWELLFTPSRDFLGSSQRSPIVRWLPVPKPIRRLSTSLPLRVLAVIPETRDPYPKLDVEQEIQGLRIAISGLAKDAELTILKGKVTLNRIDHTLIDRVHHVFHFIGHAEFRGDHGVMLLNNDYGGMEPVHEERFARTFMDHDSMKLVVLNACQGAQSSTNRSFVGLAPRLVALGIPAVVAMQYSIYDAAAVLFAREFYFALFRGSNAGRIDWAMAHARNALAREFPDDREIATPVLFMRAPEGILFYPVSGSRLRDAAFSKDARDTEKAIEATYRYNQQLSEDEEAIRDPVLDEVLSRDAAEFALLRKRIAFRNRLVIASGIIFPILFMMSWVKIFDILELDAWIEGLTLIVGHRIVDEPPVEDVVIVAIDQDVYWTWRKEYASLLNRLSEAGAKVVAFDMIFDSKPNEPEPEARAQVTRIFADAILKAEQRGTAVVLGFNRIVGDQPRIDEDLRRPLGIAETTRLGALCMGAKRGVVGIVPLVIVKKNSPQQGKNERCSKEGKGFYMSLALTTYAAFRGAREVQVCWDERVIRFAPFDIEEIKFSDTRTAVAGKCPANEPGDKDADLYLSLSPTNIIRDTERAFTIERVIDERSDINKKRFKGKIVLVGQRTDKESFPVFDFKDPHRYGVELHADALKTVLRSAEGALVIRSVSAEVQSLMMISLILLGSLIRMWIPATSRGWQVAGALSIPLTYTVGVFALFIHYRLLVDLLYHLSGFGLSYLLARRIQRRWFT